MIFDWFKKRRRAKILAHAFPQSWDDIIRWNVVHDRHLTSAQQQRLRRFVQIFVTEKNWEGCGGLTVTDEIKVTIAAQACLLVVGMQEEILFDHVLSILVYPTGYVAPGTHISRAGLVWDGDQPRLGEAWWRGPVILSWSEAKAGGRMETPGHNLVLHEFAHQLDMMNGQVCDGTPQLATTDQLKEWINVLEPEFKQLVKHCQRGHHGFIDCYGATSPAEFFAVITETLFERPIPLKLNHPEAYRVLTQFYCLDPAAWAAFEPVEQE